MARLAQRGARVAVDVSGRLTLNDGILAVLDERFLAVREY